MNSPTAVFMEKLVKKEGYDENFQAQKKLKIGDDEISDVKECLVQEKDKFDEDMNGTGYDPEITDFPESDEDLSPIVRVCCTYDSEEDYCPDYPNGKMDKPLWDKYYKQIKESEGFDIQDFPGRCWMTTVFPLPYYLDDPENYNKLKDYASKALKLYNDDNGTCFEVDKMLKVNGGGCSDFIYYLTFTVKNGVDDIFQAKVVEEMDFSLEFPIVRPKPKA
ncbi:hypothetical protein MTR67_037431 [Solanum verrucosum]|uniref:Uncharacterized protein n=1 Tax=Solanum verrucosum TaxID=315347 RepID=A0AAF0UEA6_SOLVR|nr:uncharacterized protein LOC125827037 [Solanum verrucosum]WMV44046.1 hypothetical protein MTR67_037431 [Solanum verrucosum]